jgi:hypothetical protein
MAGGILGLGAAKTNADTAGHTYVSSAEATPGTPVAATLTETVQRLIPSAGGALDAIFKMEPVSTPATSPSLVTPTSATRGPNGGLVPASLSRILTGSPTDAPGPGPQSSPLPAQVTQVASGVKSDVVNSAGSARTTVATAVASLRRRLGV